MVPECARALLSEANPQIRRAAADFLGDLREPAGLESLEKAAKDEDPLVRKAASRARRRILSAGEG